jgi:uncharacterized membrane protein YqiK
VPEETAASVKSIKTYGKEAPMTTSSLKNRRRQDIDRTRGQFDDALGELTHKIDVPARIRDKVHDSKETARVKAEEVKQQGLAKAEEAKRQAQAKAEEAEQQAQAKAEEAKQQAQAKAEEAKQQAYDGAEALPAEASGMARQDDRLTDQVLAELPSPVAERIEPLMTPERQWRLLTAAIAVGVLLVMLFLRRLLHRNR